MTKGSKLLTVAEVAERMNVSERFIRRLVFENRIAYMKIGQGKAGHVRIAESDLEAFIDATRIEPKASGVSS